jgi:hypothetical protein
MSGHPTHVHVELDVTDRATSAHDALTNGWLAILGPTATVALMRLVDAGAATYDMDELAIDLGVNTNALWRAIDRLCGFHVATFVSVDTLVVQRSLRPANVPGRRRARTVTT